MHGRRRPDVRFGDLPMRAQPGDYWRYLDRETGAPMQVDEPGNLTGGVWGIYTPDIGAGIGTLMRHTVRENEDGTITVAPGDGSSNSILQQGAGGTWHGYIERGVWRAC